MSDDEWDETPYTPLADIVFEVYRAMYKAAEPSADFDELMETGVTAKPNWFNNYYLSREDQEKILNNICDKYKLDDRDHYRISFAVYFGASPNMHKEDE